MPTAIVPAANNGAVVVPALAEKDRVKFVPFMGDEPIELSCHIVKTMICVKTKSGHTCDNTQALRFIMLCKARKLNPFEGDAYLVGYDTTKDGPQFSLITSHQAFLKRAEVHPEYDGMESGVIVKTKAGDIVDRVGDFMLDDDLLLGAWATVFFKTRKHPNTKRLNLKTFRKPFGRWNDDPAGMICKCAEADALRSAFPTQLGGMYLEDELPTPEGVQQQAASKSGRLTKSDLGSLICRNPTSDNTAGVVDALPTESEHEEPEAEHQTEREPGDEEPSPIEWAMSLVQKHGCPDAQLKAMGTALLKAEDQDEFLASKPWGSGPKQQKAL
jgi:phage recombination protein Bet